MDMDQDLDDIVKRIREKKRDYTYYQTKIFDALSSIWENFGILKEQNDLLLNCIDWIKLQRKNKANLIKTAVQNHGIQEEQFTHVSDTYDEALNNGIRHFAQDLENNNFDKILFPQLLRTLETHNDQLVYHWNDQRKKLYHNPSIQKIADEIEHCQVLLKSIYQTDIKILDSDEEADSKISQEKLDRDLALQMDRQLQEEQQQGQYNHNGRILRSRTRLSSGSMLRPPPPLQASESEDDDFETSETKKRKPRANKKEKTPKKTKQRASNAGDDDDSGGDGNERNEKTSKEREKRGNGNDGGDTNITAAQVSLTSHFIPQKQGHTSPSLHQTVITSTFPVRQPLHFQTTVATTDHLISMIRSVAEEVDSEVIIEDSQRTIDEKFVDISREEEEEEKKK